MKATGLRLGCHGTHRTIRNDLKRPLWAMANRAREKVVRREAELGRIRHLSGPSDVNCGENELVVLCLVRDGSMWVQAFVDHHLSLGAKHVFFLDNGSQDDTVTLASRMEHVSVFATELPFKHFEVGLRRWFTRTYGFGRWTLAPDCDELWEYPFADRLSLGKFLAYLNQRGFKAVTAHALDMFSDQPFSRLNSTRDDDLKAKYRFYDINDVVATRDVYWLQNGQSHSEDLFVTFGGVRQRYFGSECLCQTRHALLFTDAATAPYEYDGHFTARAPVADVTTLLRHYKFVGTLKEQAKTNLELKQHWGGSQHYRGIHDVLSANPDFCLWSENAQELHSLEQLLDAGYLTASKEYRQWVLDHAAASALSPGQADANAHPRP